MLRHENVTDQGEFILKTNKGKFLDEKIFSVYRLQKGEPTITAESDEVQMATTVIALQSLRHWRSQEPTLTNREWGTSLHITLLGGDDILALGALRPLCRAISDDMNTTSWKLFGKCVAWGFVIEAPILAWSISVEDRSHVSIIPGILFVFHFASYCLMRISLFPFERHLSSEMMNRLDFWLMGSFQAILIGSLLFIRKAKKQHASESKEGLHPGGEET